MHEQPSSPIRRSIARPAAIIAAAALLVSACGPGAPSASLAAVATNPPTATGPDPTPARTPVPLETPRQPTPSPDACPSDPPTALASVEELADPSCYGTTELRIDGWLTEIDLHVGDGEWTPSWTMALSGLLARSPTVGESIFDYMLGDGRPQPRLSVVTPPESGIDLLGAGRWVTLRGHFNDATAAACQVLNWAPDPQDANQEPPDLPCEALFVVTGLEALDRPAPVCPTDSPMTLATYAAADITCFMGRQVRVSGWEDQGEGFGGASDLYPISTGSLSMFTDAQFVDRRWESNAIEHLIFPWTVDGSGVRFDRADRQVIVTGMLGHAAASGCRPADEGWTWAPPDSWAQNRCKRLFVITGKTTLD